jgi:diadenosine tetraphosphatase ApaH/serine/threonine PP2A family protein phosphatase
VRYAIISDIHSNIEALNAVLDHIRKRSIKEVICLGDIVGYGSHPVECLDIVMQTCDICLKGNHDEALVEGVCFFNPAAKSAIEWTKECVLQSNHPKKAEMWQFVSDLPLTYSLDSYLFVHGSPLDPTSDYVLSRDIPIEEKKFHDLFQSFDSILFIGHTHLPCVITESLQVLTLDQLGYKYLAKGQRAIVNVGSVGQPRDKDPRACYLEVIDDLFFFHRIPYDNQKACQYIMENSHLDAILGKRLLTGT